MVDGALPISAKGFADAVHNFCDPMPVWDDGHCRWVAPVYTRLRGSLRQQIRGHRRAVPGSRPPCRSDVLGLLVAVDSTVAQWHAGTDTVDRLQQLAVLPHRPQDCDQIDDRTEQIRSWTITAAELLGDTATEIALRLPCPSCGKLWAYRLQHGENIRITALRVSEHGARCVSCAATWSVEQFDWLARLLGCPEIPTGLTVNVAD